MSIRIYPAFVKSTMWTFSELLVSTTFTGAWYLHPVLCLLQRGYPIADCQLAKGNQRRIRYFTRWSVRMKYSDYAAFSSNWASAAPMRASWVANLRILVWDSRLFVILQTFLLLFYTSHHKTTSKHPRIQEFWLYFAKSFCEPIQKR